MTRIATLFAASLALATLPCIAQDAPPATDAERDAAAPQAATTPPAPAAPTESSAQDAPRSDRFRTMDRLELDSTSITGNRELPKVLYIVPWKKADMGDLIGRPANSLIDEVLAPVDREVFRRQNEYFATVNAEASASRPPEPAP
jgi:hypothetical protein